MTILQTKFYAYPVVIENITASAHITYYTHITPILTHINLSGAIGLSSLHFIVYSFMINVG